MSRRTPARCSARCSARRPLATGTWLLAWALLHPAPARAVPEQPGPYAVDEQHKQLTLGGLSISVDLYLPHQPVAAAPLVALAHGFQRSKAQMAGWGRLVASHGLVAAAPSFPPGLPPDHVRNGQILSQLLQWLALQANSSGSPLHGLVDPTRRGVLGHSAGGLAALLAASTDTSIELVVALDPVDSNALGTAAGPQVSAPVTALLAEPGPCNAQGNATQLLAALGAPPLVLRVTGATHCDAEDPSGLLCTLICGGESSTRRDSFRRYALAALRYWLLCEQGLATYLGGAAAQNDPSVALLSAGGAPPAPASCAAAPSDAGPAADAPQLTDSQVAAPADGQLAPADAGLARPEQGSVDLASADAPQTDTPAPGTSASGCSAAPRRGSRPLGLALLVLLGCLVWRGRS